MSKYISAEMVRRVRDKVLYWLAKWEQFKGAVHWRVYVRYWNQYTELYKAKQRHDSRAHTKRRMCQFVRSYTTMDFREVAL